jgi:hypothetical protein
VEFLTDLVVDGLLGAPIRRLKRMRADRRFAEGHLECAFKVIEGSHRGLSPRWGHVVADVSPGRLELRRHWWRLFWRLEAVTAVEVRGPARRPSGKELGSLAAGCRIVEIQTPTATLGWAVLGDYLGGAVDQLRGGDGQGSRAATD